MFEELFVTFEKSNMPDFEKKSVHHVWWFIVMWVQMHELLLLILIHFQDCKQTIAWNLFCDSVHMLYKLFPSVHYYYI